MDIRESNHLRFNFFVNLMDGGFFGAALGFASFITVIPLFVSGLTESALLIGLIPAIHAVGWQLPQLFTAKKVSSLRLLRPTVLSLSINERLPFFGLAIVAWFSGSMARQWVLILTFLLLIWQGFGGGFTANPWQSMIGKIIPTRQLGTFFGMQSATANIFASIAAVFAGIILDRAVSPIDFTACFLFASIAMTISWLFLALTREAESPPVETPGKHAWREKLHIILQRDINFRWFLVIRMISQFAMMGFIYTVFAVRQPGMSETTVGFLPRY
jgi:MFS family permease